MRRILLAAALAALTPASVLAANAHNPYGNVDHRNDAGNDTGDSQVDALNAAQLRAARAPVRPRGQFVPGMATIYPRAPYVPPPGYYAPPAPYPYYW